ncbi:hypothetical protein AK830_g5946 [Neonectria ditissima]|uniref:Uncharacterized protein n=1 Tax=Neonectria ditissima TaxID=78410 RepID=A0A0N8H727_9HYPO|nr:hypothetical protein AK830_g5946 [Neonectria ditissima]
MISPRNALTLLVVAAATWGANAGPCKATTTSSTAEETSTSTTETSFSETTAPPVPTTTSSEQIITVTEYKLFRPRNARRDEEGETEEPTWSLSNGASVEEDAEIAHSGDHYVLVRIEADEETPSIEENIIEDVRTAEPGRLSYSWALAEAQNFGKSGVCSIVSKLDGIIVDTLRFNSNPANQYHDHEVEVPFLTPNPVFSMDFFCSGSEFSRVDVLIDDVSVVAVPVNQELR